MTIRRLVPAVIGFGVLALVLSGCFQFKAPPTADQIKRKPRVAVKMRVCERDPDPPTACASEALGNPSDGDTARLLLGLRVPRQTVAPRRVAARESGDIAGAFRLSAPYRRELNRKAPKGPKFKWVGYYSDETPPAKGDAGVGLQGRFTVVLRLKRPLYRRLAGKRRRYRVAPVVGFTTEPASGLDCGTNPFQPNVHDIEPERVTWCISDPRRTDLKNIRVRIKPRR